MTLSYVKYPFILISSSCQGVLVFVCSQVWVKCAPPFPSGGNCFYLFILKHDYEGNPFPVDVDISKKAPTNAVAQLETHSSEQVKVDEGQKGKGEEK